VGFPDFGLADDKVNEDDASKTFAIDSKGEKDDEIEEF
jgi:hypothetical protein